MDLITDICESDLVGIDLVAESNQFAIYACGHESYLLVQRHAGMPWTGLRLSGDGLFRVSGLLSEGARHLYRDLASRLSPANQPHPFYESRIIDSPSSRPSADGAHERYDLFEDDLTEERMISPVKRDIVAGTLALDPDIAG